MPAGRRPAAGRAVLACLLALVGLVGCSNRQSAVQARPQSGAATASSVGSVQQVTIDAGSDMRFHPSRITVRSGGMLRVVLHNTETPGQGAPHNFSLTGVTGARTPDAEAGQTTTVTFRIPPPGRYGFICTFHVKLGQTGTLVVEK